jgi:hypothetical protein
MRVSGFIWLKKRGISWMVLSAAKLTPRPIYKKILKILIAHRYMCYNVYINGFWKYLPAKEMVYRYSVWVIFSLEKLTVLRTVRNAENPIFEKVVYQRLG